MRWSAVLVVVVVLAGGGRARAQNDDAEARQHYKNATGHFAVGEFAEAAAEYEAAFKLHQDPALLFNAAQARRLAGQNERALVLYKNFLQLYPDSSNVPAVREQVAHLQAVIAAEEKAKNAPPTGTEVPRTVPGGTTAGAPAAAATPPATATPQQPAPAQVAQPTPAPSDTGERPTPIYKKWWLWTAVGAVVVAAVVIPVAVVESQGRWSNLPDQGPGAHAALTAPRVEVRW